MKKLLLLVALSFVLTSCGFQVVDTGHRGVRTRFGKVISESLTEGLYFYNPVTQNINEMDVRLKKRSGKTATYTKDVQEAEVSYSITFTPDPTRMHVFFAKVGIYWEEKIVPQIVLGTLKDVIGRYEAVAVINQREKVVKEVRDFLTIQLKNQDIDLIDFQVDNLSYTTKFEQAVEAKVVAIQRAEEAKNNTVRIKEEADQKIIAASAEAKSMRIRAQALTQNKALVDYEAVQKWDGKMPDIVMGGKGAMPFLNLHTK